MLDCWEIDATLESYTPPGLGEGVKVIPPLSFWECEIERNMRLFESSDFHVGPLSARELRLRTRHRMRALADLDKEHKGPIIMTGHQSDFFHPGIWIKYFILERFCSSRGAAGVNLWVDFDTPGKVAAVIPSRGDSVRRKTIMWLNSGLYTPFQCIPRPGRDSWERVKEAILENLPQEKTSCFLDYCGAMERIWERARDFPSLMTLSRRAFDGTHGYGEVAASALLESGEFTDFFLALLEDCERVHEVYNANLHSYRAMRRIRNKVNPLPDLARRGDLLEIPFWVLLRGQRFPMWAQRRGRETTLYAKDERLVSINPSNFFGRSLPGELSVRPRALTFTLFVRLFACDLFLHGMGGARYDIITDGIIRDFLAVEPPGYAAASLTLHAFDGEPGGAALRFLQVRRMLRDLEYNPQRFAGLLKGESEVFSAARMEKAALVRDIRTLSGRDKKAAADAIAKRNRIMASFLEPFREDILRELDALKAALQEEKVKQYREYPFFLFDPSELRRYAESLPLS